MRRSLGYGLTSGGSYYERVTDGSPSENNYSQLNKYLTDGISAGSRIDIPAGTFATGTGLTLAPGLDNVHIKGAGPDKTILKQFNGAAIATMLTVGLKTGISIGGGVLEPFNSGAYTKKAVASASKNATTLTMASGHGFTANGFYLVWESGSNIHNPGTTVPYKIELVKVTGISGNTFTLADPLKWDYTATPLLIDVRDIALENVTIEGMKIYGRTHAAGEPSSNALTSFIWCALVYNLTLKNLVLECFKGHGLDLFACRHVTVQNVKLRYGNAGQVGGGSNFAWFDFVHDVSCTNVFTNQDKDYLEQTETIDNASPFEIHAGCKSLTFNNCGLEPGATWGGVLDNHMIGSTNIVVNGGTHNNINVNNSQWGVGPDSFEINDATINIGIGLGSGVSGSINRCNIGQVLLDCLDTTDGYSVNSVGQWTGEVSINDCVFQGPDGGTSIFTKGPASAGIEGPATFNRCDLRSGDGDSYIMKVNQVDALYNMVFNDCLIDFVATGFFPNKCVNSEFTIDGCLVNSRSAYAGSACGSLFYLNTGHDNNVINIANGTRFYTDAANPSWVNIDGGTGNTVNIGADCHIYATSERAKPLAEQTPRAGL